MLSLFLWLVMVLSLMPTVAYALGTGYSESNPILLSIGEKVTLKGQGTRDHEWSVYGTVGSNYSSGDCRFAEKDGNTLTLVGVKPTLDSKIFCVHHLSRSETSSYYMHEYFYVKVLPDPDASYRVFAASGLQGGSVSVDKSSARAGETVTITVTEESGYELEDLMVYVGEGKDVTGISTAAQGDGKYTFVMPVRDVNVSAEFAPASCTVTFDLNGHGESFSDRYTIGQTPGLPVGPFNAVGFTFDGWYLDPSCTVPYSAVALTGDLTLYARWVPDTLAKPTGLCFDGVWIRWDAVPGADAYNVYFYKMVDGAEQYLSITTFKDTRAYFAPKVKNYGFGDYKFVVQAKASVGYNIIESERAESEWKTFTQEQLDPPIAYDSGWRLDAGGNLTISGQITNTSTGLDQTPWKEYKDQIKTVTTIPGASCNSYAYLFADCPNLISADLGNLKSNSNLNSMRDLFSGCENLKTVNLRGLNTASVTEMQYMFYNCKSLAYLDVSGLDTFSAKDMSYMFAFCSSLTSLDVSGFYAPDVVDTVGMFAGCTGIRELNLGILDARCLDSMLGMFMGCSNLQKLTFFAYSQAPNAVLAFYGCNNLMSLHTNDVLLQEVADQIIGISGNWLNKVNGWHYDTVSQLSSIAEGEAYLERTNCVVLPAETVLIGDSAFAGIKASEVVIPVGCQTIGDYAFSSCSSLRYIHIPASVTSISSNAFAGVSNLTVYAPASSYAASYATAHGFRFVKK